MSDWDFNDLANEAFDAIKEPVPCPPGTWRGKINSGKYDKTDSDNAKAPLARGVWSIKVMEAIEVSDALMDGFDVDDADPVYYDIPVFDRRGNWNIKKFLIGLGAVDEGNTDPIHEKCAAANGFVVTFETKHRRNPKDKDAPPLVDVSDIAAG